MVSSWKYILQLLTSTCFNISGFSFNFVFGYLAASICKRVRSYSFTKAPVVVGKLNHSKYQGLYCHNGGQYQEPFRFATDVGDTGDNSTNGKHLEERTIEKDAVISLETTNLNNCFLYQEDDKEEFHQCEFPNIL